MQLRPWTPARSRWSEGWFIAVVLFLAAAPLQADQVEMQNGDRYLGRVVSLNQDKLVIESDVLGTLRLSRDKVASITFGSGKRTVNRTNVAPIPRTTAKSVTNGTDVTHTELSNALRHVDTNTVQQVQGQFLAGAGPEANNKFNELMGGLMNGKLTVHDIRTQAQSAAEQLRGMKRDLGSEAGDELDGYLAILEHFLKETDSPGDNPHAGPTGQAEQTAPGSGSAKLKPADDGK